MLVRFICKGLLFVLGSCCDDDFVIMDVGSFGLKSSNLSGSFGVFFDFSYLLLLNGWCCNFYI